MCSTACWPSVCVCVLVLTVAVLFVVGASCTLGCAVCASESTHLHMLLICLYGCHMPYCGAVVVVAVMLFMSVMNWSAPALSPVSMPFHLSTHIAVRCVWMYRSGMSLLSISTDS